MEKSRIIIEIPKYLKDDLKIRLREFHKYPVSVTSFIKNMLLAIQCLGLEEFDTLLDNPEEYIYEALKQYLPAKHTSGNLTITYPEGYDEY